VRAQNTGGTSNWSSVGIFNVGGGSPPAGVATLIAPIDTAASTTPTYEWTAVSGAREYLLWVNDSSGKRLERVYTTEQAGCADGTCAITPDKAIAPGVVTWWVRPQNESGTGSWSEGASFAFCGTTALTQVPRPGTPNTVAPTLPTYSWVGVPGATDYELWVDDPSQKAVLRQWFSTAASGCHDFNLNCSIKPNKVLAPGACKWWVRARNSMGETAWSQGRRFTASTSISP
jgi:hypothetical protein